jgi:D-psicose/D-tagatose/L-ribulose 3-epimerase
VTAIALPLHLTIHYMNIAETGLGNRILDASKDFRHIRLSKNDRGAPGDGTSDYDDIYATLAIISFKYALPSEGIINRPPEIGYGLAMWQTVTIIFQWVMDTGTPFLRNIPSQYRLI